MLLAVSGRRSQRRAGRLAAALLLFPAGFALAAENTAPEPPAAASDAETFCANIGDAASDARIAWEAQRLDALKSEIEEKTAALDAKRAELEEWVGRREAFRRKAEAAIVDIYARMRPDAAAAQLAALDAETAAAVLVKLNARTAGAILAEMDTPRAVSLAALISAGASPEEKETAEP